MIIMVRFEQDLFDLKRVLLKVNAWKEFDQQICLNRSMATQKIIHIYDWCNQNQWVQNLISNLNLNFIFQMLNDLFVCSIIILPMPLIEPLVSRRKQRKGNVLLLFLFFSESRNLYSASQFLGEIERDVYHLPLKIVVC